MIFTGYNPYANQPDPPAEPTLATFKAAQDAGATHLSADGLTAYTQRFGLWFEAQYSSSGFGAWWAIEALPAGAVKLE